MKKLLVLFLLLASITVGALPTSPAIEFVWVQPTANTDGSLVTVTGNTIYCGTSTGDYTTVYQLTSPATTALIVDVVPTDGTYYCVVTAVNGAIESGYSNEFGPFTVVEGIVPGIVPAVPGNFGIQ